MSSMINFSQVETVLKSKKLWYKKVGNRITLRCFNPKHIDQHPSMFIYSDGRIYCFGCGYRSNIDKSFGITLNGVFAQEFSSIRNQPLEIEKLSPDLPNYPKLTQPLVDRDYFGLKKEILQKVDARLDSDGVIFPIYYNSKMIGWQKRFLRPGILKYMSSPKISKEHFTSYLSPIDLVMGERNIVLTEGLLDALKFIELGFPALCNFGLIMTSKKIEILKNRPTEKIILALDSDEAGIEAETKLFSILDPLFKVECLPSGPKKNPRENLDFEWYKEKTKELING